MIKMVSVSGAWSYRVLVCYAWCFRSMGCMLATENARYCGSDAFSLSLLALLTLSAPLSQYASHQSPLFFPATLLNPQMLWLSLAIPNKLRINEVLNSFPSLSTLAIHSTQHASDAVVLAAFSCLLLCTNAKILCGEERLSNRQYRVFQWEGESNRECVRVSASVKYWGKKKRVEFQLLCDLTKKTHSSAGQVTGKHRRWDRVTMTTARTLTFKMKRVKKNIQTGVLADVWNI